MSTIESTFSHAPVIQALEALHEELRGTPLEQVVTLLPLGLRIEEGDGAAISLLAQRPVAEQRHILGLLCMRRPAPPELWPLVDTVLWQGSPQESFLDRTLAVWRILSEDLSAQGVRKALSLARYEELHLFDRIRLLGRIAQTKLLVKQKDLLAFAATLEAASEKTSLLVAACTFRLADDFEGLLSHLPSAGSKLEALTYQRLLGLKLTPALRAQGLAAADEVLAKANEIRDITLARKASLLEQGDINLLNEALVLASKHTDDFPFMRSLREIAHAASLIGHVAWERVIEESTKAKKLQKNHSAWQALLASFVHDLKPLVRLHGNIDRLVPLMRELGKRVPDRLYDLFLLAMTAHLIATYGERQPLVQISEIEAIITKEGLPRPGSAITFDDIAHLLRSIDEIRAFNWSQRLPSPIQKVTWLGALSSV